MDRWVLFLAGLIVWVVHFFALYIVGSVFLTTPLARLLTLLISALCLAADALLLRRVMGAPQSSGMEGWMRAIAISGLGLSIVAIIWQALPALLI